MAQVPRQTFPRIRHQYLSCVYARQHLAHRLFIEAFEPTFCKVLVRYNPEGDKGLNQRQAARLQRLSEYLHTDERKYMFELLVPATPDQLHQVGGVRKRYDLGRRPLLMVRAIRELQDAGVEP